MMSVEMRAMDKSKTYTEGLHMRSDGKGVTGSEPQVSDFSKWVYSCTSYNTEKAIGKANSLGG